MDELEQKLTNKQKRVLQIESRVLNKLKKVILEIFQQEKEFII